MRKPSHDEVWKIDIVNEYGDSTIKTVEESSVPKKIKDRSLNGDFGNWLEEKYGVSQSESTHIKSRIYNLYIDKKRKKMRRL